MIGRPMPSVTESEGSPDPDGCRNHADVGSLHHDVDAGVWYECVLDERTGLITWAILPPSND